MYILIKMLLVLGLLIFLLKRKTLFGNAMLAATLFLFLLTIPETPVILQAAQKTITKTGTWFMILTLYFVMCLEYILRTSGILKDFTASARKLFGSDKILLGLMPAFLGLLPTLGGAIFSAPLVKESGERFNLSPERLTAINYWFRHVWEYMNPIIPAMLLASQITLIPVGAIIANQFIFSIAAILIGIPIFLTGKAFLTAGKNRPDDKPLPQPASPDPKEITSRTFYRSILLATGPIFLNILLVIVFDMNTALSLALVLAGMAVILKFNIGQTKKMFISAFDGKIHWAIINILFFQEALFATGSVDQIVAVFEASGIPVAAIIGITAFAVGLLTGSPEGFVAVAFPLIIPLAGNMDVVALSFIAGVSGTMFSPSHLCLIVTLEYFKADFLKSLLPVILAQVLLIVFALAYIYFF